MFLIVSKNAQISEFSRDEEMKEQIKSVIISWLHSDTTLLAQWTNNLKLRTLCPLDLARAFIVNIILFE